MAATSNLFSSFRVEAPNVRYDADAIHAVYTYHGMPRAVADKGALVLTPTSSTYEFKTLTQVPRTGVMVVGWGGNNGTTLTGMVLANKHGLTWQKRSATHSANYTGSMTQASTVRIGSIDGRDAYVPFHALLPTVNPNDLVLGGAHPLVPRARSRYRLGHQRYAARGRHAPRGRV